MLGASLLAPLVPSEIDLRTFPFMPLDVQRLRLSRIAQTASGDEFRAAVLLWAAAWHEVPASSLPDDDGELAVFAGFGRDIAGWLAIREGALHGFVKCSDGRLYHPVIAEKAMNSWGKKAKRAHAANTRWEAQRARAMQMQSTCNATEKERETLRIHSGSESVSEVGVSPSGIGVVSGRSRGAPAKVVALTQRSTNTIKG